MKSLGMVIKLKSVIRFFSVTPEFGHSELNTEAKPFTHGTERPPLFAPVLSFFQPFHDLSTLAREAPGQTVSVKGERLGRMEGS